QLVIAIAFGVLILQFPDSNDLTPGSTYLSFDREMPTFNIAVGGTVIGMILFLIFINIVISAWSNAVNLTDGLDRLPSGVTAVVMGVYVLITCWQLDRKRGV